MSIQQIIQEKLQKEFSPIKLEIRNDSKKHIGHKHSGEETHFHITIVSEKFANLKPIERHRLVYACLKDELKNKIHALSLNLKAP